MRPRVAARGKERGIVLVVEDEPLIMLELEQMLGELGWHAAYLAGDIDKAMEFAEHEVLDLAILDVNVKGKTSFAVAHILEKRNVPIILATGYSTDVIAENYPRAVYLQKPYVKSDLARALERAVNHAPEDDERRRA
jgi:DNA-binding NtrC family response regulator